MRLDPGFLLADGQLHLEFQQGDPLTLPSEAVASLPGGHRGEQWISPSRFRLAFPGLKVADNCWRWSHEPDLLSLTVGRRKLEVLQEAFAAVAAHRGDFCVPADDQKLHGLDPERMSIWFW